MAGCHGGGGGALIRGKQIADEKYRRLLSQALALVATDAANGLLDKPDRDLCFSSLSIRLLNLKFQASEADEGGRGGQSATPEKPPNGNGPFLGARIAFPRARARVSQRVRGTHVHTGIRPSR